ncbi:MAG: CCA tRNA nucleotidyltransferase [Halothece sp.]
MSLNQEAFRILLEHLPFHLDLLPQKAYIVGGAVRDALLKRQRKDWDIDFVLATDAIATARKIADRYQAGFVVLDPVREIARVVFAEGTLDFALQEGESLETDLRRRDFTINAIAFSPHTQAIIDPLHGVTDLEKQQLTMVSRANLEDDPLRLLRAYRQAAQLNFTIEPHTRSTLRSLAPLLGNVAAERVQTELGYLLTAPIGSQWIKAAWEDGLLSVWLRNVTIEKLQHLENIDGVAELVAQQGLQTNTEQRKLAKLACLVSNNPKTAQAELADLKYSRADSRAVTTAVKHLPQLFKADTALNSLRARYFFFLDVGDIFPIEVLLAAASGANLETISPLIQHYINPKDQVAHPTPLVTGKDLMRSLSLRPSPVIGELLTAIQIARIEGKVTSPEEAIQFASQEIDRLE